MSLDRFRPVRLNAAPRTKNKPRAGAKSSKPGRGNRPKRPPEEGHSLVYWIAGLLVLVLILVGIFAELPRMEAYFNHSENSSSGGAGMAAGRDRTENERLEHLRAKVDEEARSREERLAKEAAERQAAPPATATPPALHVASPAPSVAVKGPRPVARQTPAPPRVPPRALPLDPNRLDTERIAAYQVALERIHFSCGFIDGDQGMRTQRMLRAFQGSRGLPQTGFLDSATRAAIGEPGEPFLTYTVTAQDVASVMPSPVGWKAKAEAKRLGYNTIWELLAEKFHCTRAYLKGLNPGLVDVTAGTEVIGPKVFPAAPIPRAASLRVNLGETSIEALDASGRVIAFFPCSIAKDKNKRPNGTLTVKSVVPDPDYTFDPELFPDSAKAQGLTKKMVLPPGPRNPVGVAWIGLSLPGYGIHGTPEPENISRTQSHGCFRLANWNAEKVLKMVKVGTPVDVRP